MTEHEKYILKCLNNYESNVWKLTQLSNDLEAKEYKITPSYSQSGGRTSGKPQSKVENYAISLTKLKRDIAKCQKELQTANQALQCDTLTKRERAALEYVSMRISLTAFAEAWNIYSSYAYKIRDKALGKASKYISG